MTKVKDYERMDRHQKYFKGVLPEVIPVVKQVQYKLRNHKPVEIVVSKHSKYREVKREISYRAVLEVIRSGKIIEYQGNQDRREELDEFKDAAPSNEPCVNVILMKKVFNKGKEQYIHVCVNIQGDSIVIKTVYDPTSMYWQWTGNFSKRVFYKERSIERPGQLKQPKQRIERSVEGVVKQDKRLTGSYIC